MSNETKNKIVPELRFPQFRNAEEWSEKPLGKVCEINPSVDELPKRFVYIDLESVEDGRLLQKKVVPLEQAPSRAQRLLKTGDVIFQMVRPYQKNNYFFSPDDDLDYVASTGYAQLRAYQSNKYLFQYLHNQNFTDRVLAKCTGTNYPAINSSELSEIFIEIPSLEEQQKIATCLSSLDDLITAETQKLDALKAHKKGLMQQLFPAEGETVPKLRFKEFKDSGEWEEKRLGDICDVITKGTTPQKFSELGIRFVKIEAFEDNQIISERCMFIDENTHDNELKRSILKENDILFAIAGATIGKVNIVPKSLLPANTNQALAIVRLKEKENKNFILHVLKSQLMQGYIKKSISVGAQPNLNLEQMSNFSFAYPNNPNEQQKVANSLSSLDELITLQSKKIEIIKLHKKGLMQQLFPNVIENNP